ncbi:MAG TPA: hypothetical protein VG754_06595 [Verrucomicrobiae bacterium]|nr:hypothetical protein [Verrucomicrobiae bacterium]
MLKIVTAMMLARIMGIITIITILRTTRLQCLIQVRNTTPASTVVRIIRIEIGEFCW